MNYNSLVERHKIVTSIKPGQYAAATQLGASCNRGRARVCQVLLNCGVVPSGSTIDVTIHGQNRTSAAWENILDINGSTLAFTQRTNAAQTSLVGQFPTVESNYDNFRAIGVVAGGSGAAYSVEMLFGDTVEHPLQDSDANVNAWATKMGAGARAAALS